MVFNKDYWKRVVIDTSKIIDDNIDLIPVTSRSFVSSNVLSHARDLLQAVSALLYTHFETTIQMDNRYKVIRDSQSYIKGRDKYSFLTEFYKKLSISTSHYTLSGEFSERVMLNCFDYFAEIKRIMLEDFSTNILNSLSKIPMDLDDSYESFYRKIIPTLEKEYERGNIEDSESFYIQRKKTLYLDNVLFYEYTLSNAHDNNNKFDRFVAYSKLNLFINYAIRALFIGDQIDVFGKKMDVMILTDYWVAIRPCEFKNFASILGIRVKPSRSQQYDKIMAYVKKYRISLANILLDNNEYRFFVNYISSGNNEKLLLNLFEETKTIIDQKKFGYRILLYLLATMNNSIIKSQKSKDINVEASNLYVQNKSLPFEHTPFSASLRHHNPSISILLGIFDIDDYSYELIKREIDQNSNQDNVLYYPINKDDEEHIMNNIEMYNSALPHWHQKREIGKTGLNLFIKENENNSLSIIRFFKRRSSGGISGYEAYAKSQVSAEGICFDDPAKEEAVLHMFSQSFIFCIYGAAGTGKSTLISKELQLFKGSRILCLANTHPAIQNLKNKIINNNVYYMTIARFLSNKVTDVDYDILVVDECSIVSTRDMASLLTKIRTKCILLSGDICQIESIEFGNWYYMLKSFLPAYCCKELTKPFRTEDEQLLGLWDKVRRMDETISDSLSALQISHCPDNSIFTRENKDEIVLCLNYDGLYGINSINKILQLNNPNNPVKWKQYTFKKDDPIIFNESNDFGGFLYNNLKGTIASISIDDKKTITFDIDADIILNPIIDYSSYGFIFLGTVGDQKSRIRLSVYRGSLAEYDEDTLPNRKMPFQIAYAVSIHKAQGLEYDSVKIVITNEIGERISHNIFYTAITRAKKTLKIYWTPETERKVLSGFKEKNVNRDISILSTKYNLNS